VNVYEQLMVIRERLEQNGANEASIEMIDTYLAKAEPERDSDTSVPMAMMLKHLLRQREALDNDAIYNDLQEIADDGRGGRPSERDPDAAPYAWEEERRPRPHSYYRQQKLKDREKK
jgi:hypothetical protein